MSKFDYDYDVNFDNTFDLAVLQAVGIPNLDETLTGEIQTLTNVLESVINLHPGIKRLVSFIHNNDMIIRIRLNNVSQP